MVVKLTLSLAEQLLLRAAEVFTLVLQTATTAGMRVQGAAVKLAAEALAAEALAAAAGPLKGAVQATQAV